MLSRHMLRAIDSDSSVFEQHCLTVIDDSSQQNRWLRSGSLAMICAVLTLDLNCV